MKIAEKRRQYRKQIDAHLADIEKAVDALTYSRDKCRSIDQLNENDLEVMESFEALAARFARASDLLTQKVLKSLFIILQEEAPTLIDRVNFLAKLKIIPSADTLLNIREIRNQIAHEYVTEDIKSLYQDIIDYTPALIETIKHLKLYVKTI